METPVKRYNVTIRGRVQEIGLRDLIAQMANFLRLKGYVYNEPDGSVKMVVEGTSATIDSFLKDVETKTSDIGAEIKKLDKKEVLADFDLPPRFVKIPSTELEEIGKKLDLGVRRLGSIDNKLSKLDTMDTKLDKLDSLDAKLDKLDSLDNKLSKLDTMDTKLDKLDKLDTLVKGQEKMINVLEKIASK